MASNVTTSSAGPRLTDGLLDRVLGPVDDHLLLDARVHLDRVVDAHAEHHRQAGDRDDRQRDAEVPGEAEGPRDADEDDEQREQPPPHPEQQHEDHDHDRRPRWPRGSACRRAGSRSGPSAAPPRRSWWSSVLANGSAWAMASTRSAAVPSTSSDSLPSSRVIICAWPSSGKNGRSDLRISPRLSNSRNSTHSGFSKVRSPWTALMRLQRGHRVIEADRLGGRVGLAVACAEQGLPGDALGDVARRAGHHVLGELQGGQRADDAEHALGLAQVLLDLLEVGDVLGREQVGDRLALVHGEQGDHGLPTEEVLVGDAVLVDLLVLVQVRVLPGGEVELGDAEPEDERDRQPDDADDARMLAEVEGHPGPDASHGDDEPSLRAPLRGREGPCGNLLPSLG